MSGILYKRFDPLNKYEESYDKLILVPGAAPIRPLLHGIDLPGFVTLRNLHDMDRIRENLDQAMRQQAVVVRAGFIGLEQVENFVRRGIATTVVELQDQVLPFDKEMTTPIAEHRAAKGVSLLLGQRVSLRAGK